MILFENYNTARQKYGIEMVNQLSKLGLPLYFSANFSGFCFAVSVFLTTFALSKGEDAQVDLVLRGL